jgi:hypothetical protein
MTGKHVIFVDSAAGISEDDKKKLEQEGFIVIKVIGNPNQVTRRETFSPFQEQSLFAGSDPQANESSRT